MSLVGYAAALLGAVVLGYVAGRRRPRRTASGGGIDDPALRFRALAENSGLGIVVARPDGRFIYCNDRYLEQTGVSREEVYSGTWIARIHPEDREPLTTAWARASATQTGFAIERRVLQADGSTRWGRANIAPVRDETGGFIGFVATVEDVTEARRTEAALRESEDKFSRVFQIFPDVALISRAEDGCLVAMNNHWEPFTGWAQAEALGRSSIELGFWADPEARAPIVDEVCRLGEVRRREIEVRRKDGTIVPVEYSARPFTSGGHHYLITILRDLSAAKRAEAERAAALAALSHSEARFRAIFDQTFQFMGVLDTEGTLLQANRSALDLVGLPAEAVLGRPFWETPWWQDDDSRQRLRAGIAQAVAGTPVRFEAVHRDREGVVRHVDFSLKPVRDGNGHVSLLIPEGHDITSLKLAQAALRLSEAKFAGAFHASLDYITLSDLESGVISDVNRAFELLTGWSREEAIGRRSRDLGIWRNQDERQYAIDILRAEGYLRDFPMTITTRAGDPRACLLNASIVAVDGREFLLGVVRDVTDKLAAEAALRDSETKFSAIFNLSPLPLALTGADDGRFVDVNEAWLDFFGYRRAEVIGRDSAGLGIWARQDDRTLAIDLAAEDRLDRLEAFFRTRAGETRRCQMSGRSLLLSGRRHFLCSIVDVTELRAVQREVERMNTTLEERVQARTRELEAANAELADTLATLRRAQEELVRSEKLAALGALVAGVAHELNTPIGNSVTIASTLHDRTEEFRRDHEAGSLRRSTLNAYVESAATASDLLLRSLARARELITGFKQVAVDQTSEQRRPFDLAQVIEEVVATLAPTIRKTPVAVSVELDLMPGLTLDSYPGPLGQILVNLITNALTHAFEGRTAGRIRIECRAEGDSQVRLVCRDDGCGIPPEHLRHIFDPFFTTRLGRGGSGLGLNIVYNIATRVLGGDIAVHSASTGAEPGTVFTLTLPRTAPRPDPGAATAPATRMPPHDA